MRTTSLDFSTKKTLLNKVTFNFEIKKIEPQIPTCVYCFGQSCSNLTKQDIIL